MSIFMCAACDNLRDSDDGCREGPRLTLICADCMDDDPDEGPSPRQFTAEQQAIIDAHMAEDDGEGP